MYALSNTVNNTVLIILCGNPFAKWHSAEIDSEFGVASCCIALQHDRFARPVLLRSIVEKYGDLEVAHLIFNRAC